MGASLTIGIDVGITGAIAMIDQHAGVVVLEDLPVMCAGKTKWIDPMELLRIVQPAREQLAYCNLPARAFVEHVHAMPRMGSAAAHSTGLTLGSTLAALQVIGIPLEFVAPQTWKRALGLIAPDASDRERKAASLSKARLLFPAADLDRVKDHNRAEALLIAHYGLRHVQAVRQAA